MGGANHLLLERMLEDKQSKATDHELIWGNITFELSVIPASRNLKYTNKYSEESPDKKYFGSCQYKNSMEAMETGGIAWEENIKKRRRTRQKLD